MSFCLVLCLVCSLVKAPLKRITDCSMVVFALYTSDRLWLLALCVTEGRQRVLEACGKALHHICQPVDQNDGDTMNKKTNDYQKIAGF